LEQVMAVKAPNPASMFEKALRAFELGDLRYSDLQSHLDRLLETGASPQELVEVLLRNHQIEPLPEYAHDEVLQHLNEAIELAAAQALNRESPSDEMPAADERVAGADSKAAPAMPQGVHPAEQQFAPGQADYAELSRVYERTREFGSTAVARAKALAAELATARTALESERANNQQTAQALAESNAYADALQARSEQAEEELKRVRQELREAREAQFSHEAVVSELDGRLKSMQAEVQAARSRAAASAAELKVSQDALAALRERLERDEQDLAATRTEFAALRAQSNSYLESLRTREWQRDLGEKPPAAVAVPDIPGWRPGARALGARALVMVAAVAIVLLAAVWALIAHQRASRPETAQSRASGELPAAIPAANAPAHGTVAPAAGTVIRDCPTCPAMRVLPAGRFKQGSAYARNDPFAFERPLHWVVIAYPFALSINAVTVDQFRAFVAATGRDMQGCETYDGEWKLRGDRNWDNPGFPQSGSHPVTCVSWADASAFAAWLSKQAGHRYRLPSASEWEYAAVTGGASVQPWNQDASAACAHANVADASAARRFPGWAVFNCNDGYVYTAPVGSFKPDAWGLNDMLGNVLQWTEDCWFADYKGAPIDGSARTSANCTEHELRGGSWFSSPAFVRANYRNHFDANYRTSSVGIRLVREVSP
jgi:formylglycine-generating enzyme required for sulfatase activity